MAGKPAGVILAGGRSKRMGVSRKALLEFGGRTLLARIIERLRPQVGPLVLSCETAGNELQGFGLPVVADLLPRYRGPLTGLYSVMQHLSDEGFDKDLLLCPCDAPFVPLDLAPNLLGAGLSKPGPVVVSYRGVLQPTFSLWRNHHLGVIREAVLEKGLGGLKHVLSSLQPTVVEWPVTEPPPFFNINTPADLENAMSWLDPGRA